MMTRVHRPEDLPDFRDPPLVETVLSLRFKPLEGFSLGHVGLLWHQFRSEFPLIEEHSPLPVALDLGRSWVVKGFAALTTTDMHRVWGRIDA